MRPAAVLIAVVIALALMRPLPMRAAAPHGGAAGVTTLRFHLSRGEQALYRVTFHVSSAVFETGRAARQAAPQQSDVTSALLQLRVVSIDRVGVATVALTATQLTITGTTGQGSTATPTPLREPLTSRATITPDGMMRVTGALAALLGLPVALQGIGTYPHQAVRRGEHWVTPLPPLPRRAVAISGIPSRPVLPVTNALSDTVPVAGGRAAVIESRATIEYTQTVRQQSNTAHVAERGTAHSRIQIIVATGWPVSSSYTSDLTLVVSGVDATGHPAMLRIHTVQSAVARRVATATSP